MVGDLPSAGTRGGRQVGKIVFLITVTLAAVVVIAQPWAWPRAKTWASLRFVRRFFRFIRERSGADRKIRRRKRLS